MVQPSCSEGEAAPKKTKKQNAQQIIGANILKKIKIKLNQIHVTQ